MIKLKLAEFLLETPAHLFFFFAFFLPVFCRTSPSDIFEASLLKTKLTT